MQTAVSQAHTRLTFGSRERLCSSKCTTIDTGFIFEKCQNVPEDRACRISFQGARPEGKSHNGHGLSLRMQTGSGPQTVESGTG